MAAVALAWESQSMSSVGCLAAARQAARFTAVVVFPTPPFWLATAMILAKHYLVSENLAKTTSGCKLFHVEQLWGGGNQDGSTWNIFCPAWADEQNLFSRKGRPRHPRSFRKDCSTWNILKVTLGDSGRGIQHPLLALGNNTDLRLDRSQLTLPRTISKPGAGPSSPNSSSKP